MHGEPQSHKAGSRSPSAKTLPVTIYGRLTSGRRAEFGAPLWPNLALSRSRAFGKSFLQLVVTSMLSP
jgi:hypothetical protein